MARSLLGEASGQHCAAFCFCHPALAQVLPNPAAEWTYIYIKRRGHAQIERPDSLPQGSW
jgi:hypothetical protein